MLVWFWATWNDSKGDDLAGLQTLYTTNKGERFHVVTVNLDPATHQGDVNALLQTGSYGFPVIPDYAHTEPNTLATSYGTGLGKTPGNYLLGPGGTILLKNLSVDDATSIIALLLATDTMYQPVEIDAEVSDRVLPVADENAISSQTVEVGKTPESLLFSVNIDNPQAPATGIYDAKFSYRALVPTSQKTYLRLYPDNPSSELITSNGKPVLFEVMAGDFTELPNQVEGTKSNYEMDIPLLPGTAVVEYYAETWSTMLNRLVTGERGKEDFLKVPYCTPEALQRQGGAISSPE